MVLDPHLTHPLNAISFLIIVSSIVTSHASWIKGDTYSAAYSMGPIHSKSCSMKGKHNEERL